jgi:hypothetical protein
MERQMKKDFKSEDVFFKTHDLKWWQKIAQLVIRMRNLILIIIYTLILVGNAYSQSQKEQDENLARWGLKRPSQEKVEKDRRNRVLGRIFKASCFILPAVIGALYYRKRNSKEK